MIKKSIFVSLAIIYTFNLAAQELRCNVQVTSQQIQGTNKQIFETLQRSIFEFMNNNSWTGHSFGKDEQIECNMLFNMQEQNGDQLKGTLQIQVRRPVFNSSYNTVLLNIVDNDLDFLYVEFQSLDFSENSHLMNLTSILAYYAYIIIGTDYDSFSLKGGTPFFQKAEKIVTNAQNAREKGWRASESSGRKNRYWLVRNILDEDYSPVREFYYKYHRLGLDLMYEEVNRSRADIAQYLELLKKLHREKPDPFMYYMQVTLEAKSDEWVNIFKASFQDEKTKIYALLTEIDPSHRNKYDQIIK
jgi:hypothetical protein